MRVFLTKLFTVCSIYLPPCLSLSRPDLLELIDQLPSPFLLLGDFNARHPYWGDITRNAKGSVLESLLLSDFLCVLNTGDFTSYHVQTDSFSCVDLSVCSPDCFTEFRWSILDDLHGSDHFPIVLSALQVSLHTTMPLKWDLGHADWEGFQEASFTNASLEIFNGVDAAVAYFTSTIYNAATQTIPRRQP